MAVTMLLFDYDDHAIFQSSLITYRTSLTLTSPTSCRATGYPKAIRDFRQSFQGHGSDASCTHPLISFYTVAD